MQPDAAGGLDLSTVENTESCSSDSVDTKELTEAKELLRKVDSWSEEEIERLPPTARKKVRQYRGSYSRLVKSE